MISLFLVTGDPVSRRKKSRLRLFFTLLFVKLPEHHDPDIVLLVVVLVAALVVDVEAVHHVKQPVAGRLIGAMRSEETSYNYVGKNTDIKKKCSAFLSFG